MTPDNLKQPASEQPEMTLRDLIVSISAYVRFLVKKIWIILAVTILCIIAGLIVGRGKKVTYEAQTTFILQESGSSGSQGGLAFLGMGDKKAGLFEGDNLKWLYSTRLMLSKALLTNVKKGGQDILLVDWLLQIDRDGRKAIEKNAAFRNMKLSAADTISNDVQKNALMGMCIGLIKSKYLKVKDQDKTEGVIQVIITADDENFAKTMCEVLVENVNQYYVQSKTEKLAGHVKELEAQIGEYNSKMNASLYSTAAAIDAVPYPNPNNQVNLVAPKRKGVDAELNSNIYIQLMRSLETSRMELQKALPLIQVIDGPVLPLPTTNKSASFYMIMFGAIGFLLSCVVLIAYKFFRNVMATS